MCTVSWLFRPGGYQLLCNRDEKRTRPISAPPAIYTESGWQFLSPRDTLGGGSWIAVNAAGVSLALLNGNGPGVDPTLARSRGLLPLRLIRLGDAGRIVDRLQTLPLDAFPPFRLLIFCPSGRLSEMHWANGEKRFAAIGLQSGFVTSSSVEPAAVAASRAELFSRMTARAGAVTPGLLYSFHESHGKGPGPHSPCMHRPDAHTVSFSWIRVSPERASFFFSPGAPCQWLPGTTLTIPRTATGAAPCSPSFSGLPPARSSVKTLPASLPARSSRKAASAALAELPPASPASSSGT